MGFVDWTNTPGIEIAPGDTIWSITGETVQMIRCTFEGGSEFPGHTHPHEQLILIVSGSIDFVLGEQKFRMDSGSVVQIPPNVYHQLSVVGDEPAAAIEVFAPPREDFIDPDQAKTDFSTPR